ncbi:MAG TPA: hypothetical protein VFU38_09550 [Candidatus Krumholzibacteria bacterium]|nr:hypothetical protein [Candidatus Krumholzibacteria bacterium]
MLLTAIKILLLGAFVVLITCAVGLFIMAGVAQSHDVVRVPVPSGSYIAGSVSSPDYTDAYVAPMQYRSFANIDRVAQQAFHRGDREVYRSKSEVAYEGEALGIAYVTSYILVKETSPQTLTVATSVKLGNKKARYCWMVAKQVHRRLMPYLIDRMVVTAPD